jgi:hypothetical protein
MTKENEWLLDTVKELETTLYNENEPVAWEEFSPAEFDDIGDRLDDVLQYWKSKAESNPAWQGADRKARDEIQQKAKAWADAHP